MITKYATNYSHNSIKREDFDRESEHSLWVGTSRRNKRSEYANYFDTWDEAHAHILAIHERRLESARLNLQRIQGDYGNVKGMKNPYDKLA